MAVANTQTPLVPDFDIVVNGSPFPMESKVHVMEVKVDDDVSLPGMFTLVLTASDDQEEEIPWIDDEDLFASVLGTPKK